jgi:3-oxoacyl-[acyl-carrier protein] reductase
MSIDNRRASSYSPHMLKGKTILITGSSRGIGAATARLAKKYGARVILHGRTESRELKKIAKKLKSPYVFFDISDERSVRRAVKKLKRIDIVVNNAGINPSKTFAQLTVDDWRHIFEVNVFGIIHVSKAVIPGMVRRKHGKIINIASIKGLNHISGKPAYAASKAAVMRITSSMAEEYARHNILINAVAPGFIETKMTKSTLSPAIRQQIKKIPLKRMAKPMEIAEAISFLVSDKSNYMTGQTIIVDGGYSING